MNDGFSGEKKKNRRSPCVVDYAFTAAGARGANLRVSGILDGSNDQFSFIFSIFHSRYWLCDCVYAREKFFGSIDSGNKNRARATEKSASEVCESITFFDDAVESIIVAPFTSRRPISRNIARRLKGIRDA